MRDIFGGQLVSFIVKYISEAEDMQTVGGFCSYYSYES